MSEEDLELLVTLDDPAGAPEEDIFNHLQNNNLNYWLDREFAAREKNEKMPPGRTS